MHRISSQMYAIFIDLMAGSLPREDGMDDGVVEYEMDSIFLDAVLNFADYYA